MGKRFPALINSFIDEVNKEPYASIIVRLGIKNHIDKLERLNKAFEEHYYARAMESLVKKQRPKLTESKKELILLYSILASRISTIYNAAIDDEDIETATEADIYVNGGANALGYINTICTRAGAINLTGTPTVRTVLDERGRELCGEYSRFYDLKRTGMFKGASYLREVHPDLAVFFKPEYALRPISTTYTATIANGAKYQNPGY